MGDALGYAVEFIDEETIRHRYGPEGIREYELDERTGKALISDDTQMSLFTANGILNDLYRQHLLKAAVPVDQCCMMSYFDWLLTQQYTYEEAQALPREKKVWANDEDTWVSWIAEDPRLYSRRAPGNTCLSSLSMKKHLWEQYCENARHDYGMFSDEEFKEISHTLFWPRKFPCNQSKGCGAIMRIAPYGCILPFRNIEAMGRRAADIGAVTHGHPLGFIPAAVLAHVVNRIVYPKKDLSLKEIVLEARETTRRNFYQTPYIDNLLAMIDLTLELSENDSPDLENIHRLGEGWTGDEALCIGLYCSLRHPDDFSEAIISAVNHNGDSDSTGAVAGNIVGALVGYDHIDEKWKKDLELEDLILELSEDLARHDFDRTDEQGRKVWELRYSNSNLQGQGL